MGASGTALLAFGAAPGDNIGRVTITGQTGIVAGIPGTSSLVEAWINYADSSDHPADEHLVSDIKVKCGNIVAGVGFDIIGYSDHQHIGSFNVNWVWV